jgi:hypothetical protein
MGRPIALGAKIVEAVPSAYIPGLRGSRVSMVSHA